MRIAIITFAWSVNYGAALQALALQRKIRLLGGTDVFIVPILPAATYEGLKQFVSKSLMGFMYKWRLIKLKRKFQRFRARFCYYGRLKWQDYSYWLNNMPDADLYVVGSDQVWNPMFIANGNEEKFYFLHSLSNNKNRISYAASWGVPKLSKEERDRFLPYLLKFNGLSAREKSGMALTNEMGLNCEWLPDPTLLFNKEDWCRILGLCPDYHNTKVVSYQLDWDSELDCLEISKKVSAILSCDVIAPFPKNMPIFRILRNPFPAPDKWVEMMFSASFVVTNSFHGTVFAILGHRPFVAILVSGKYDAMNERVISLLERLGLQNRIIRDPISLNSIIAVNKIDWDDVDRRLQEWRDVANNYLSKFIKNSDK